MQLVLTFEWRHPGWIGRLTDPVTGYVRFVCAPQRSTFLAWREATNWARKNGHTVREGPATREMRVNHVFGAESRNGAPRRDLSPAGESKIVVMPSAVMSASWDRDRMQTIILMGTPPTRVTLQISLAQTIQLYEYLGQSIQQSDETPDGDVCDLQAEPPAPQAGGEEKGE